MLKGEDAERVVVVVVVVVVAAALVLGRREMVQMHSAMFVVASLRGVDHGTMSVALRLHREGRNCEQAWKDLMVPWSAGGIEC